MIIRSGVPVARRPQAAPAALTEPRILGWLVSLTALLSGAWYLWWRLETLGGTGLVGIVFLIVEVMMWTMLLLTAATLIRARVRTKAPGPPRGSCDVFVTVCGEPLSMVERTIAAADAIDYPHQTYLLNDGRIAGKEGSKDVDDLAQRSGVECFTRRDGPLGKAGNLNHALRRTTGDFIVTIDADHVADPSLADQILGYFAEDDVAFVATRQRFETPGPDVLNNNEPIFYDCMQPAKDADDCAISCGNATVYRRAALESIAGFSEWNLVEDLHTSFRLHAAGWKSAFHAVPVTVGTAPATAAVFLKQRMRWAMDSLRLLFKGRLLTQPGMRLSHRLHYLHTTGAYLALSLQVVFLAAPAIDLLFDRAVLNPDVADGYLLHAGPYLAAILAFLVVYGGPIGGVRTMQTALFTAPTYVLAAVRTLLSALPDTDPTEKDHQPSMSLLYAITTMGYLAPVGAMLVALNGPVDTRRFVVMLWAGLLSFMMAGPLAAISTDPEISRRVRLLMRGAVVVVVAAAAWVVLAQGGG